MTANYSSTDCSRVEMPGDADEARQNDESQTTQETETKVGLN